MNSVDETRCHYCGHKFGGAVREQLFGAAGELLGAGFPVTRVLVGVCIAVFAFCVLDHGGMPLGLRVLGMSDGFDDSELLRWGALRGDYGTREPFRRLAAVFGHLGWLHLALNLMSLVDLGAHAERHFGSARFLVLVVIAGYAGFWLSDVWYGWRAGASPLTAGASGAIFGIVGGDIGRMAVRRDPALKDRMVRVLVYAVIFALLVPVNNAAHIGGFLAGATVGAVLQSQHRPQRFDKLFAGLGTLAALAAVGSIVLSLRSPIWQDVRSRELEAAGLGSIDAEP
ncbi:MAG TPA: rhomboid family intramembrane serine protease [Polyangiaceae bacterium]|nr:rhomboid family intramembrane serine protease [Polyangiaceae bacterium]